MSYTDAQISAAVVAVDKYRGGDTGEVGAALQSSVSAPNERRRKRRSATT